ncbi:MAG TPA: hypothetical protein VGR29_11140 [Thermomicrobiales bacterium]|nr:hypothetical protein [Thermomicrobiales bacterium]
MMKRTFVPTTFVAAIIFAMSIVFGAQVTSGQGGAATPSTQLDTEGGAQAHPAHIHSGTCEELGDVVFPLNDVAPLEADATPAASPAASPAAGLPGEMVVAESTTILEVALDDILGGEHAINVHESAENIDVYIACGNITGTPENNHLRVDLQELNDSGLSGRAVLTANPDGTTTVTVTLTQAEDGATGTPEASPAT